MAAVALVVLFSPPAALAIEAFQERFEWGDMSKPTTLQGRVIILDPYDEAVWINVAVFGGNAESGLFWQKIHPGKNVKLYAADKNVWEQIEVDGSPWMPPGRQRPRRKCLLLLPMTLVELIRLRRPNRTTASSPRSRNSTRMRAEWVIQKSISSLRLKDCVGKDEMDKGCAAAKQGLNTTPKGEGSLPMQYDVLAPGGKPLAGLVPWTAQYNMGGGAKH